MKTMLTAEKFRGQVNPNFCRRGVAGSSAVYRQSHTNTRTPPEWIARQAATVCQTDGNANLPQDLTSDLSSRRDREGRSTVNITSRGGRGGKGGGRKGEERGERQLREAAQGWNEHTRSVSSNLHGTFFFFFLYRSVELLKKTI